MIIIILKSETVMRYDTEHKQKTRAKVLQAAARAIRATARIALPWPP